MPDVCSTGSRGEELLSSVGVDRTHTYGSPGCVIFNKPLALP
jgi:hypothetical protein